MIRRWLRGCLLPTALCLTAIGCTPSVESLTGGFITTGAPAAKDESDAQAARGRDELPADDQLRLHLDTARQLDKAGNDAGALEQYEQVLALDPSNFTAMRRLCCLYDRRGSREDFKKAEELYRKVAKVKPNDPEVWSDWGYSLFLRTDKETCKENWAEAEKKLRQALKLNPLHARAHNNLGLVLGQLERYDEAFREFRAAQLSEAEAHCDMAVIYLNKGKLEEAKQACRMAREKEPSNTQARELLLALEQPPHPRETDDARGRRGADRPLSSRSDGAPRASRLSEAQLEAEHEWARRVVATGLSTPGPAAAEAGKPGQSSGPVVLPSGARWMPVNAGSTPTTKGPPAEPVTAGSPGTITIDN